MSVLGEQERLVNPS